MFTHLKMTNFKSWVDTGDVRLAPLTGFFGANSSGKSGILQMLLLLKQTTESTDRNLVLKTGNIQEGYVNLGTVYDITHGDSTDMHFSVTWRLPHLKGQPKTLKIPIPETQETIEVDEIQFETHIYADPSKTAVYVKKLCYRVSDHFFVEMARTKEGQYNIKINVKGHEPKRPQGRPRIYNMKPQKCYGFSDEALRFYQNTEYLNDLILMFEQQFKRLHYLGPLREYPQRDYLWGGETPSDVGLKGEQAIHALLAAKDKKVYEGKGQRTTLEQRIAEWLVNLGLASSFETRAIVKGRSQYEVRLRRHEDSAEVLITDLGIGVSQILPVLVLCYYVPSGSTLILEQPELHLHPSVQSGLADVFIDVVQRRNIQLIIESHSEHLLRRLQRRIAEGRLSNEQTALYFCDIDKGVSNIETLEIDEFGNIRNWPLDFFGDMAGDMVAMLDASLERQARHGG